MDEQSIDTVSVVTVPCPFCGSDDVDEWGTGSDHEAYVICIPCGAQGPPSSKSGETWKESCARARAMWNVRAAAGVESPPPSSAPGGRLRFWRPVLRRRGDSGEVAVAMLDADGGPGEIIGAASFVSKEDYDALRARVAELEADQVRHVEALEWYAREENYHFGDGSLEETEAERDGGLRARRALEEEPDLSSRQTMDAESIDGNDGGAA